MKNLILGFLLSFIHFGFSTNSFTYVLEDDYTIIFQSPHVKGVIGGLVGEIYFNPEDLNKSIIELKADVNTLNTGYSVVDKKLLEQDWLHAALHPNIEFKSLEITKGNENSYNVKGVITIKGVNKIVDFPLETEYTENGKELSGFFAINRMHFNITEDMFGVDIGEMVKVGLHIPLKRKY